MRALFASAAFALALPASLVSAAQSTDSVANVAAPAPKKDQKVCKFERLTGSRLNGTRVCMKESEWEQRRIEAQRMKDKSRG